MTRTPLVAPAAYFSRPDAFDPRQAILPTVAFWLAALGTNVYLWSISEFVVEPRYLAWLYQTLESTLLTLLLFTLVVYVLRQVVGGDGEPADALVLAAWALVPAIVARVGAVASASGPFVDLATSTELAATVVFALVACLWAGYCWRDGFRRAFDLERSVATPTAVLGVVLCATLVVAPLVVLA